MTREGRKVNWWCTGASGTREFLTSPFERKIQRKYTHLTVSNEVCSLTAKVTRETPSLILVRGQFFRRMIFDLMSFKLCGVSLSCAHAQVEAEAQKLRALYLICHYLIWGPQVSRLPSGPQRESHYMRLKSFKLPHSVLVGSILPLLPQPRTREREPTLAELGADITFYQAENSLEHSAYFEAAEVCDRVASGKVLWVKHWRFQKMEPCIVWPRHGDQSKGSIAEQVREFVISSHSGAGFWKQWTHTHFRVPAYSDTLPHWEAFKMFSFRWG